MKKLRFMICLLVFSMFSSCSTDSSSIISELQEQITTTLEADYIESSVYLDIKTKNMMIKIDDLLTIKSHNTSEGIISNILIDNATTELHIQSPIEAFIDETTNQFYISSFNNWTKVDMSQVNENESVLTDINRLMSNVLVSLKSAQYINDINIEGINHKYYTIKVDFNEHLEIFYNIINLLNVNQMVSYDEFITNYNLRNLLEKNNEFTIDLYIDKITNTVSKINFNLLQIKDLLASLDNQIINDLFFSIDFNDFIGCDLGIIINKISNDTTLTIPEAALAAPLMSYNDFINNFNSIIVTPDHELILGEHFASIKHPSQPIIYFIDQPNRSLVKYNIETNLGQTVKFPYLPEKIVFANNQLYVTLIKAPHNLTYTNNNFGGAYAVVNANNIKDYQIIDIHVDPYDIAVSNDGLIYIINKQAVQEGNRIYVHNKYATHLATWYFQGYKSIIYNPIVDKLYMIETTGISNPEPNESFNIGSLKYDVFTKVFIDNQSLKYDDYPIEGKMFISPDGQYLFNASGVIFSCNSNLENDKKYIKTLEYPFTHIEFNINDNEFYLLSGSNTYKYEYDSLTLKSSISIDEGSKSIYYVNEQLYLVGNKDNNTFITPVDFIV